jgi:ribose-phosphate pyrophosphokinase
MPEMVIVSDYAGRAFGEALADRLMCDHIPISIKYFPDGEADIQVMDNVRGKHTYYVCPFFPKPLQRWSEIILANSALKYSRAEKIIDVPTYLGFMKKDFKDKPRTAIAMREVFVSAIEPYAHGVITMELHSPQIQGMCRLPFDPLTGSVLFAKHINEHYDPEKIKILDTTNEKVNDLLIMSPDIGGVRRTRDLVKRTGRDKLGIIPKERSIDTGEISVDDLLGDIEDKDAGFLDDQAITLGSLIKGAYLAKERGAKNVYAYCTHGLMVPDKKGVTAEKNLADSDIDKLYITDTIWRSPEYFEQNPKIELISCVELFAKAIKSDFENKSISELFK